MQPTLRAAATAILISILSGALHAQALHLVKDIQPGTSPHGSSSSPQAFASVQGRALIHFAGTSGTLWSSDGTAAGTIAIAELDFGGHVPQVVAATPQRVFFRKGSFSINGSRLWRSDGTKAGTWPLTNGAGLPLAPLDGKVAAGSGNGVFVAACDTETHCGVWFNSGITPGSLYLAPLDSYYYNFRLVTLGASAFYVVDDQIWAVDAAHPGERLLFGAASDEVRELIVANEKLYFVAASTAGDELWASDGTSAGTSTVTGFANPSPFGFISFQATGGRVYFIADDIIHGQELWSTDGTAASTRRETDFGYHLAFGGGLSVQHLAGGLVFAATDGLNGRQLWVKSAAGAISELLDPCGPDCSPLSPASGLTAAAGRAFFVAADIDHGYETWSTDGTHAGTRRLVDACPGSCGNYEGDTARIQAIGDRAYFWAGEDLWLSDGTPSGTYSIYSFELGQVPSAISAQVVKAGPTYFFVGFDPVYGSEIFVSDGTPASGRLLTNLISEARSSEPSNLTALGERVVFTAGEEYVYDRTAWVTDGTPGGTEAFADTSPDQCLNSPCSLFARLGNLAFFLQYDSIYHRIQLWRTDGTATGTYQITQLDEGFPAAWSAAHNGVMYFVVSYYDRSELWSSNGTAAGTSRRFTLPNEIFGRSLASTGSELLFVGTTDGETENVWRTDGTLVGTRPLTDFAPYSHALAQDPMFTRLGSFIYFRTAGSNGGSAKLWRTNGTLQGLTLMASAAEFSDLIAFDGALYFFAHASTTSRGLWRLDPASTTPSQVADFTGTLGNDNARPHQLTIWNGDLAFVAGRAELGAELWRSDGTTAGTMLIRDIRAGERGSGITGLTTAGVNLYFSADDGVHGPELWHSDGTAAGTQLVEDLWPGSTGSQPAGLTVAAGRLLFAAREDRYGRELWSLDLAEPRQCVPEDGALCLGGRFRVTADWRDFQGNTGVGHAVALSGDTGYFWFFRDSNVEAIVKVLDGRGVNGHHWVFYGALSNVEYTLSVTDVETGATRRYFNPQGQFASVGDTQGFGPLGAFARMPPRPAMTHPDVVQGTSAAAACVPTPTRLCLNQGRFAVEATWKDFQNHTGVGTAVALTGDTGYFWFFSAANVETVVKVLDGRPANGKFWVFYGALSNVEYTLTVTDTVTGAIKQYRNPSGRFASVGDTGAF